MKRVQVVVEDVNDNRPVLAVNPLVVHVRENNLLDMRPASGASLLGRVGATDADAGLNAALNYSIELLNRTCSLPSSASTASASGPAASSNSNSHLVATSSAPLLIDPSDGSLHAAVSFDREICSQYNFQVPKLSEYTHSPLVSRTIHLCIIRSSDK